MSKIRFGFKLFLPHMVILLFMAAGIVISLKSFTDIGKRAEAFYNDSGSVKISADKIDAALESVQKSVYRLLSSDSPEVADEALADIDNSAAIIRDGISAVKQNFTGNPDIITNLDKILSDLEPLQDAVLELAAGNKMEEAAEYMENNIAPAVKEAQKGLARVLQEAEEKEKEQLSALQKVRREAVAKIAFTGIAGVLFSMGIGIYQRAARVKKAAGK